MTDNEIIKALEICSRRNGGLPCEGCPAYGISQMCMEDLMSDTLDLINRQKAKIRKWKKKANTPVAKVTFDENKLKEIVSDVAKNIEFNLNLIKSEAIKEFAERWKENDKRRMDKNLQC